MPSMNTEPLGHVHQAKNQPDPPNDMHPIAPQRRPFRPHFMHLFRLALTRFHCAHLALLVGPEALSPLPPSNCAKLAGAGVPPPLRAPARRPGWATPSPKPQERGI
jgi:hypothetical protein